MSSTSAFAIPAPLIRGFAYLLDQIVERVQPPHWLTNEAADRLVLLLNHVLMQEPVATERLERQAGRTVQCQWRNFQLRLHISKAGLLERLPFDPSLNDVPSGSDVDLCITLKDDQTGPILNAVVQGENPALTIEGDVQLAADINWLVDHVRWDIEDDFSRIVGDVPAHALFALLKSAWRKRPQ